MINQKTFNEFKIINSKLKIIGAKIKTKGMTPFNNLIKVIFKLSDSYDIKTLLTMSENLASSGLDIDQIINQLHVLVTKLEPSIVKENEFYDFKILKNLVNDASIILENNKLNLQKQMLENLLGDMKIILHKY